jgi:hypothetical protein
MVNAGTAAATSHMTQDQVWNMSATGVERELTEPGHQNHNFSLIALHFT